MKGQKLKYFTVCMPYVKRKSKFQRFILKLFNKKRYYYYMRCLAKQRVEEKIFLEHLKETYYDKYLKNNDLLSDLKNIIEDVNER